MALKRSRKKAETEASEIPMTPMIDVVFQLLIYFLVTLKPEDTIAHLDVFRPTTDQRREEDRRPPKLVRIGVYPDGFSINDRAVGVEALGGLLERLASYDREQTILIICHAHSPHENLVRVLDLCARSGLSNLSVMSR